MSEPKLTAEDLTGLCAKYRRPGIRVELDPRVWYQQPEDMARALDPRAWYPLLEGMAGAAPGGPLAEGEKASG